eukprot:6445386-Pyramimonas_sp.AAC.1
MARASAHLLQASRAPRGSSGDSRDAGLGPEGPSFQGMHRARAPSPPPQSSLLSDLRPNPNRDDGRIRDEDDGIDKDGTKDGQDYYVILGSVLRRVHLAPRTCLWSPLSCPDLPVPLGPLGSVRSTRVTDASGSSFLVKDDWQ